MNAKQINNIKIVEFLRRRGINHKFKKHAGNQFVYVSPFRNEERPSFFVNHRKNVWFDHGASVGGNLIDLIMHIDNKDFQSVLNYFNNPDEKLNFSFNQQRNLDHIEEPKIWIDKIYVNIINKYLKDYLIKRKIPYTIGNRFLEELRVITPSNDNPQHILGFRNNSQGFEIRNKYFKGSISPKTYTLNKGKSNVKVNVFEGVFDFLSHLVFFDIHILNYDTLVLNSVSNLSKTETLLKNYTTVNLFLDNDNAGVKGVEYYKSVLNNVVDYSKQIYPNHKDFNDYLVNP